MGRHETHIEVKVPVRTAYDQWTQFEEFPQFMDGVKAVQQIDDKRLHWVADIGGKRKEWDAEITHQEPDKRIAWTSIGGARNAGAVTFRPIDAGTTEVTLELMDEPSGAVEKAGESLGFTDRQVKEDLENFKKFIESRGTETGAWRGSINPNR